jgi:hypothetical protein
MTENLKNFINFFETKQDLPCSMVRRSCCYFLQQRSTYTGGSIRFWGKTARAGRRRQPGTGSWGTEWFGSFLTCSVSLIHGGPWYSDWSADSVWWWPLCLLLGGPRTGPPVRERQEAKGPGPRVMTWWRVLDSDSDESRRNKTVPCLLHRVLHHAQLAYRGATRCRCIATTACACSTSTVATERAVHVQVQLANEGDPMEEQLVTVMRVSWKHAAYPAGLNNRTAALEKIQDPGVAIAGGNLSQIDSNIDIQLQC